MSAVIVLPRGAYVLTLPACLSRHDSDSDFDYYLCTRPWGHGDGRCAEILWNGKVLAVWGEDVHAEARAKTRCAS